MAWIITGFKKLKDLFEGFCNFVTMAATAQPEVVGSILLALIIYFLINHFMHVLR